MMNRIALIYMGGTFGCIGEPLAPMSANAFIPKLKQQLDDHSDIDYFVAPTVKDSSACTAYDWLQLAQCIQTYHAQGYQYFVIIHGTDTLSYASAVLSHILAQEMRVILTGSQQPLLDSQGLAPHSHSDALPNLHFAFNQVRQVKTGVYLSFNQEIFYGIGNFKLHTSDFKAFTGYSLQDPIQQPRNPLAIHAHDLERVKQFRCINLMIQPIDIDQQIINLKSFLKNPPHCIFIQGFGSGNLAVDAPMLEVFHQLSSANCALILTTQVPFGRLSQQYAISEWMKESATLVSNCYSHADLYAKSLKMYLQYQDIRQWHVHWNDL